MSAMTAAPDATIPVSLVICNGKIFKNDQGRRFIDGPPAFADLDGDGYPDLTVTDGAIFLGGVAKPRTFDVLSRRFGWQEETTTREEKTLAGENQFACDHE